MKSAKAIQRGSVIPLYYQLETSLKKRIISGEFKPNQLLPGETALAEEYGVSRITVRQALSSLVDHGIVIRMRGKGTFVSDKLPPVESAKFSGSFEDLVAIGVRTKVKLLSMKTVEPEALVKNAFQLADEELLYRIEKIRSVEGAPFSYVMNYLPRHIGKKLNKADLSQKPLLTILRDDLGIEAKTAAQTIEATAATPEVAGLLAINVGDPLLKVERTVYDKDKAVVEHVSVLYRADKYSFNVELGW